MKIDDHAVSQALNRLPPRPGPAAGVTSMIESGRTAPRWSPSSRRCPGPDRARLGDRGQRHRQCLSGENGDSPMTEEQMEKLFLTLA